MGGVVVASRPPLVRNSLSYFVAAFYLFALSHLFVIANPFFLFAFLRRPPPPTAAAAAASQVAILAKRGQCSYETKARVASTLTSPHGAVRFLIVYDDQPRDGDHLITMMPRDDTDTEGGGHRGHELWKGVGLVFVSYESGVGCKRRRRGQRPRGEEKAAAAARGGANTITVD